MRIAKSGRYGGDITPTYSKILVYALEFIFLLPILFGIAGIVGVVIFVVILLLTRRWLNNRYKDKSIRTTPNMGIRNPNKIYTCNSCGNSFKGQRPNCPHCGIRLNYND
jgi:uncharacterized paraquat-inducible protein A